MDASWRTVVRDDPVLADGWPGRHKKHGVAKIRLLITCVSPSAAPLDDSACNGPGREVVLKRFPCHLQLKLAARKE